MDLAQLAIRADSSDLVRAKRDLDALPASSKRAESATSSLTKSYSSMGTVVTRLIGVLGAAGLGATILKVTDQYSKLNAQLSIAARTQADYTKSMQDVIRISNLAQSGLEGTATLYARLANTLKDTNVTQQQFANITESVALGLRVSGASVGEAQSAMLQLSQAFASGVLRGEEFNAVAEASFPLMKALADSMGIPIEQLRSMAMEGKITRNELVKAFSDQALIDTFKNQAKELNTVSGALQVMKNNLTVIIGEINATTGASNGLAQALLALGNSSVIRVPFETLAVLGVNIAYVFKQIGNEIGGIAAQLMALVQFDFKRVGIIRDMMLTDAKQARIEVDALSEAILNPKTTKGTNALSTEAALINTNLVTSNNTAKATIKAVNDIAEQQSKEETRRLNVAFWLQEEIYKAEKERIETANKLQAELDKEIHEARQKYIAIEQQRANDNFKEAQEAYRNQVSNYEKIFDRANENLSRSLTDSIVRGFENGENFITNFKNAITNAFKGYFVNIGVNFVQEQLSDLFGGIGKSIFGAFSGGQASFVDGIMQDKKTGFGGVLSDLGSIFTKSNQSIIGGIESVGASIANGMGGIRDTIGGFLGSNASLVANVASYGGAVLQLAQGNWAGAAGTAIGTALGGPIGGAIGSFLGNAVGGLFGGKAKTAKFSTGANTTYADGKLTSSNGLSGLAGYGKSLGGSDGLVQLGEQYSKLMGNLFKAFDMSDSVSTSSSMFQRSSSKTRSWAYFGAQFGSGGGFNEQPVGGRQDANQTMKELVEWVLGKGVVKGVQSSTLPDAIKDLFNGITTEAEATNMINATITLGNANQALIDSFNLTAVQAAKVAMVSGQTGDELAKVVNLIAAAGNESRKIGDALFEFRNMLKDAMGGTIYNSLKDFDNALKGIDKSTQAGIEAFYELFSLRGDFAKFTQSIDGLRGGVKGALFSIVSDAERQQMLNADLSAMFAELNMTVPGSIQELIALGKSIDYTTAEGLNLASVFPTLVNAFNTTKGAVDGLINSLTSSRFETFADFAIGSSLARQGVGLNQIPVRGASQGGGDQVAILLTRLIAEVSEMKASTQQTADNTLRTTRELEDIAGGNVTLSTQAA